MFQRLFGRERANRAIVDALYASIVAAARQPVLYSEFGAPDTPLGRFEMINLHMFLTLRRLRGQLDPAKDIAQELVDQFFSEVDDSLRALGIGDTGVPKRARKLASMFYGRVVTYGEALDAGDVELLTVALSRNVRPDMNTWSGARTLAQYLMAAAASLDAQEVAVILSGKIQFPPNDAVRTNAA
jgi:cytochrome b pre-mRNA-processing protein 3